MSKSGARSRSVDLERYRDIVEDWPAFLAAASRPEPAVVRARTGRITPEALADRLRAQGFSVSGKEGLPGFFEVGGGPGPVSATREHWLGLLYQQQASTGVAAPALAPQPGERVLDLCAAPGGKTTHLAQLMDDRGCLVASEISESRIRGLLGNVYRLGHTNVFVVAGDGRQFPGGALFDKVLVDAPCSGEGTLRRREGKAPRQSSSFLGYVTRAQRELLRRAIALTRPGGSVLYVTCTFAPEENEAVVDEILRTEPVELEPLALPVPHAPGLTAWDGTAFDPRLEGSARIYPHHFDSGGLYLAKLVKLGDGGAPGSRHAGWSAVPAAFPTSDEDEGPFPAPEAVGLAVADLRDRFGVPEDFLAHTRWMLRGGRLWLHSLEEWPHDAWGQNGWRPVSVGFRAVEFDSRGRPRPTNDLLQWLGRAVTDRVMDLDAPALASVLRRDAVPLEGELRGPVALRFEGEVLGRGAATRDGLKSEIPKARAADLARGLATD